MEEVRKYRINRLKKIIVFFLLLLLLLPTVLSIVLFGKVASLEKKILEIAENERKDIEDEVLQGNQEVQKINLEENLSQTMNSDENLEPIKQKDKSLEDNRNKVYLTFDDGPSYITNEILDILKEYEVKATFFVVGKKGKENEAMYRRIVNEGHTLGLHSYSHVYSEIYESIEAYMLDLMKLQMYLKEVTGINSTFVRFPGGSSNNVSKIDMREVIAYLDEMGMTYFDWNATSGEEKAGWKSVEDTVNNATATIDSQKVTMILMHDSGNKSAIVQALPLIIEKILIEENRVILPITEETVPIQHKIE